MKIMNTVKDVIIKYLAERPPAKQLFSQLLQVGDIYLIGGVLREYRDNNNLFSLRDIDIIVDVKDRTLWRRTLEDYGLRLNRFGGYKLCSCDVLIDAWALGQTWAFKEGIVKAREVDYVKFLPKTVFLNIDAIIYDWTRDLWYDQYYHEAMESKVLDVVLRENPQVMLNLVRTLILQERYQMDLSAQLKEIIRLQRGLYQTTGAFIAELMNEQKHRYCKEVISMQMITAKVESVLGSNCNA